MKLWHVAQWGNPKEGPNGWDTQCVVSAISLEEAIAEGSLRISYTNGDYRDGKADVVTLLGSDDHPDGPAMLIFTTWVKPAYNLGRNPSWRRTYWDENNPDKWEENK